MRAILTLIRRRRTASLPGPASTFLMRNELIMRRLVFACLAILATLSLAGTVRADDLQTFRIEIKDGVITPKQTEVPANKDFKLEVANTGTRDGDDVVQLYATPPASSQPQEIRALCGFARVHLAAGEKRTVRIDVPAIALRRWSVAAKDYAIPSGEWTLGAGASSADIRQTTAIKL